MMNDLSNFLIYKAQSYHIYEALMLICAILLIWWTVKKVIRTIIYALIAFFGYQGIKYFLTHSDLIQF